jgi:hypothetical protein
MTTESRILFDNIRKFRDQNLLMEGVGDDVLVKAINNHQYLYIYYEGDENNKGGYRTIRPYVLGTNNNGKVLRAWQDNSNSYSFQNRPRRPNDHKHDYWVDDHFGGIKPGWRFFSVKKITKAYPTGDKFNDKDGKVIIPSDYHEGGDDDMNGIIAYVSSRTEPTSVPVAASNRPEKGKWARYMNANKNSVKLDKEDVIALLHKAKNIYKKAAGQYFVVVDDIGNLGLVDVRNKKVFPKNAIVGNLTTLYDRFVTKVPTNNDKFYQDKLNTLKRGSMEKKAVKEGELPSIPFERKPFFKT